ncbi:DUF943 family protein [Mixta tenebrionis]|uniref:DUF943 family protein n=3 Tax=Mixta tenebrionis TaxID=2562439 RepID=A0A506VEX9_9GAMM|nr:DUF943 family protein [Mixta tenebrionis]
MDKDDIRNWKFSQLYFFKTWFVLQRSKNYGFKPFLQIWKPMSQSKEKNMLKNKIVILMAILLVIAVIYIISNSRAEIIVTDQELNFSNIAVKHFPVTEKGKIAWWKENKQKLKHEFNIPVPARNGDWYISIWNYGEGFKAPPEGDVRIFNSETRDMMCFNKDINKCIEKELLMRIENNRKSEVNLIMDDTIITVK